MSTKEPNVQNTPETPEEIQREFPEGYVVNPEKNETVTVDGTVYRRLCIKTHVITDKDNIVDVVEKYAAPLAQPGDIIFITEKAVACTQNRAIPMEDIHPRPLARFLSKFVLKTPYGIGLGIPETMEMAIQECGTFKILFAAAVSAIGKLFHKRGWFYDIAGYKARSIDGPCHFTLPPYNRSAFRTRKGIYHMLLILYDLASMYLYKVYLEIPKYLLILSPLLVIRKAPERFKN